MTRARGKRLSAVAALGVATVLVATGCSVSVKSGTSNVGPTTLLVGGADNGSPALFRNFNPFSPNKRNLTTWMYEPLEVLNNLNSAETPFLATGYTQPDAKTVDFTIRKGVKWSDGKAFTPADVVFTLDMLKAHPALDVNGDWQHIKSLSASGDHVVFHLKTADVPAAKVIEQTLIVPEHIWRNVKDPVTYTDPNPVVTGPYTLERFTPNQYTLAKNKNYWQADKVAVQKIVVPGSASDLAIATQGFDWAYSFFPNVDNTWVKADKQHNSYWFPPGGIVGLLPNLTKAPFNNLNFRQGLSDALDRQQIADKAEQGYVKAASQTGLLLPNEKASLNPAIPNQGVVTQNTTAAYAAFAKAGYTKRGGKLVNSAGKALTVNLTTPDGWADWLQGAQEIIQQLRAVGITVKLDKPQPAGYQQDLQNGEFDLALGTIGGSGSLFQDYNNQLNSDFKKPVGTSTASNFQRYGSAATDSLLDQLKATSDPAKEQQLTNQLQNVVYQQLPFLSIFYGGLWGLSSDAKFTGWPSTKNPYASLMTWGSTPLLVMTHLRLAK
ncbi:ABC transporter substrate-binding protein [Actinacidiphila yeochonensis]|uniref:ABC transporter substrate-binding protein n=1 Tax=Actinacidiphila yeochonensis TaxID=89050 RepID=UPI00055B6460|nr:ABC transporter substrate-binding protein [Actinacidiphila yeochonensis]